MSFLTPLFLLGGLAIALPIVFHLIRHTTRERTLFSSLIFLRPSPPRLSRRSRLEDWLLLLLRCLALGLLAFGFARPFLKTPVIANPAENGPAQRLLLLVDTSASMRRPDLWDEARQRAQSILRNAGPGDQVALYTFDRQTRPLVTFQQWNAASIGERASLALSQLAALTPGWSATHLGNALMAAAEILTEADQKTAPAASRIVLISDLQEGSHLETLQGYEWPKGVECSVEILKPRHPGNAMLQQATGREGGTPQAAPRLRLRVSNAPDSSSAQLRIGWSTLGKDFVGAPAEIYVPPGQSRIVAAPELLLDPSPSRLILQGDSQDFDNFLFAIPPQTARVNVHYFGDDSETDPRQPLYFLQRAFQETPRQAVKVVRRSPEVWAADPDSTAPLWVVSGALSDSVTRSLRHELAAGKTLLFAMRNEASAATLARLLERERLPAQEIRPSQYALLAEIEFRHPLFAPFADPRFSDFTKIHVWKYCRIQDSDLPEARVLARFDSNDPAILEVPAGQGRLFIFTFGWLPEDSQMALSTKFVPLLYSILELSSAASPWASQYFVGDIVPLFPGAILPSAGTLTSWTVRLPDQSSVALPAGATNFTQTSLPGVYAIGPTDSGPPALNPGTNQNNSGISPAQRLAFTVNLDPDEGRTAPLALEALEKLGAPMARATPTLEEKAEREIRLQNSELENRQKLWRWLVLAALSVLLIETALAGLTARRKAIPPPSLA